MHGGWFDPLHGMSSHGCPHVMQGGGPDDVDELVLTTPPVPLVLEELVPTIAPP